MTKQTDHLSSLSLKSGNWEREGTGPLKIINADVRLPPTSAEDGTFRHRRLWPHLDRDELFRKAADRVLAPPQGRELDGAVGRQEDAATGEHLEK